MATSTEATAPAKKSNTMMYAAIAIIIIIVAGVAAYFAFFSGGSTFTPTVTIRLNGNGTTGWNGTSPGPTINVKLTDNVRIVLLSTDGGLHNFVIAYSGGGPTPTPPSGDKVGPNFSSTTTSVNFDFTPDKAGSYKYYCQYHSNAMFGTIVIS